MYFKLFFILIFSILLTGCQLPFGWNIEKTIQPTAVTIEGILESENTGFFTGRYHIKITEDIHVIASVDKGLDPSGVIGQKVVVRGIWTPKTPNTPSSFVVLDFKPLSFSWKKHFFSELSASFQLPSFIFPIVSAEKNNIVFFQKEGKTIASTEFFSEILSKEKKEKMIAQNAIPITIGKFEALRTIDSLGIHIYMPNIRQEFILLDTQQDTSLWYSIIETYELFSEKRSLDSSEGVLPVVTSDAFDELVTSLILECFQYTQEERCNVNTISIAENIADIEYLSSERKRVFLNLPQKILQSKYVYDSKTLTWKKEFGDDNFLKKISSSSSLFFPSLQFIPDNFSWMLWTSQNIQIAYPSDMIPTIWEEKIIFAKSFPPFPEEEFSFIELKIVSGERAETLYQPENNISILPYSDKKHLELSYSKDFSDEIIRQMGISMIRY